MYVVRTIVRQYPDNRQWQEDMEQEGYMGLIAAAEHYHPDMGVKFSSYATWWVRKYILKFLRQFGHTIRIPQHHEDDHVYSEPLNKIVGVDDGEALTYEDVLTEEGYADTYILQEQEEEDFAERLQRLTAREWEVLNLRYGLEEAPVPTPVIAERLGITKRMVQIIIQNSAKKMRL